MVSVSSELLKLIRDLQSLKSLSSFSLAGGTNLAIRFNHRRSVDIDLFSNMLLGKAGLAQIEREIKQQFNHEVILFSIQDPGEGEQYLFIRTVIAPKGCDEGVKVEIIQNIPVVDSPEVVDGIRMLSVRDIGLLKLMSVSNRKAIKDIYDLDFITEELPLGTLMLNLSQKQFAFADPKYRNQFDLSDAENPVVSPESLLAFDEINYQRFESHLHHSNDILDINLDKKTWPEARRGWKRKVKEFMRTNGIEPPGIKPVN
jgi:hypothetical protein